MSATPTPFTLSPAPDVAEPTTPETNMTSESLFPTALAPSMADLNNGWTSKSPPPSIREPAPSMAEPTIPETKGSMVTAPGAPKKAKIPSNAVTGTLNVPNDEIGKFIGNNGNSLKKYVTGKSQFRIREDYEIDFDKKSGKDSGMAVPSELGFIHVNVKLNKGEEGFVSYKITLHNNKENLSKYVGLVEKNLIKHSENFSKEKLPEDKFSHKFVFSTMIPNSSFIGKFFGKRGNNVKILSDEIKSELNVKFCYITMKESHEEMGREPRDYFVIDTSISEGIDVNIIVSMNLPKNPDKPVFEDALKKLSPIMKEAVHKLIPRKPRKISINDFLSWADRNDDDDDDDDYDPNYGESVPSYR